MDEIKENKIYKFKVDNKMYDSAKQIITGYEILKISNNDPPDRFRLDMKMNGGATKKIQLSDDVDLALPGLEKFMITPLGPIEG